MNEHFDVSLISDTTFKYLFKSDKYKTWLSEIIKIKTGIDLSEYELYDNEDNSGTNRIKDYRMDLVFRQGINEVIIEMQDEYSEDVTIKNYQYLYRKAGNAFAKGERYKAKKTTLIIFNNYHYPNDNYRNIKMINYTFTDTQNNLTKEDIDSYEIFLPNYHKMSYNDCNKIDKRLWLFSCKSIQEMQHVVDNERDKSVIKELEMLNMNDKFREEYIAELAHKKLISSVGITKYEDGYEEGREEGRKEGKEEGREEGRKEGRKEGKQEGKEEATKRHALNLYNNGGTKELIIKALEITKEELDILIKENESS